MTTQLKLGDIAREIGADVHGDPELLITGLATLQDAGGGQLSFLANPNYARYLERTGAAAVILAPQLLSQCPTAALVMKNPYVGYARASRLFEPKPDRNPGIHATATVSDSASIGEGAYIGPGVVVEDDVIVGADTRVEAGCILGFGAKIGAACLLHPRVTLYHGVELGNRVVVHSGTVIGADGFGFAPDANGFEKIAQLGRVVVGDNVEIGANTTIDRGALGDTVIESGVKLDNQIQIAHNVRIGANTVIAACTGVSGSSEIGRNCMVGGGVGIAGHLKIADGVHLTGMTLVTHDLNEPGVYSSGTAVEPNRLWRRNVARFRQLDQWVRRIQSIERLVKKQSGDKGREHE